MVAYLEVLRTPIGLRESLFIILLASLLSKLVGQMMKSGTLNERKRSL